MQKAYQPVGMSRLILGRWLRLGFILAFGIAGISAAVVLTNPLWFPFIYRYLDVSQLPRQADVIVVLGGGNGSRERYAAELYHQGYAPLVLVSGHSSTMSYGLEIIAASDVPLENVLINSQATTTYNEAEQVLAMLLELQAASALIVTNRSHTRRAIATYNRVFASQDILLTIVAPDDGEYANSWLSSPHHRQVLLEYPKMFYYWLVYGVWSG